MLYIAAYKSGGLSRVCHRIYDVDTSAPKTLPLYLENVIFRRLENIFAVCTRPYCSVVTFC